MPRGRAGPPLHLFVLLFALSAIPGVLVAYDPSLSIPLLLAIWLSAAIYFSLAFPAHSEHVRRMAAVIFVSLATGFALYLICQYRYLGFDEGGFVVRLGLLTSILPDLGGPHPHPNAAAVLMGAALPAGVALALTSRRAASRFALWVASATNLYAIFLTVSRGAWLALIVTGLLAVLAAFALPRLHERAGPLPRPAGAALLPLVLLSAAGIAALPFLASIAWQPLPDAPPILSSTLERASDRLDLYLNSLYLIRDYPFTGAGLGDTFGMVYSRYGLLIHAPFLSYPHNLLLSAWFSQGLLGLVSMAGIGLSLYALVVRVILTTSPSPLFHGAWLGATVTLLHGLTDAPQYDPTNSWVMPVLFVAIGLTAAEARAAPSVSANPTRTAPISAPALAGLIIASALLLLVLAVSARPMIAAWHTNMGALAETRSDLSPGLSDEERGGFARTAEAEYRAALSADPGWAPAQRRLGNLLVKLERFEETVPLLESAWQAEPGNPSALKGLGLAYGWAGRTEEAATLLRQVAYPSNMKVELPDWSFYWSQRQRPLLAAYALESLFLVYPEDITPADLERLAGYYSQARQPN